MDSVRELKSDALNPESKYVSCPYNSSHRILRARMQYHLVKCRRNFKEKPEEEKVICPLDATHHINKEELTEHLKVCPNRKIVDTEYYPIGGQDIEPAISYTLPDLPPCEENWDDPNEPTYTYDPTHHLENQPILRTMHGVTKSERKAFRQVERMKMIQFHSGQPLDTATAAAAAGVTIANGKFVGCGRGQVRLPLGRGKTSECTVASGNKVDLDEIEGDEVGHIVPCPVEVGPLRPPREPPKALKMVQFGVDVDKASSENVPKNPPAKSLGAIPKSKPSEQSGSAGIVSGFGLNASANGFGVQNDLRKEKRPIKNWWNEGSSDSSTSDSSPQGKQMTADLEQYKEKVQHMKLVAKLGLSANEKSPSDDDRAREFTYLDEEWHVQGRRGRTLRGSPHTAATTVTKGSGRKW